MTESPADQASPDLVMTRIDEDADLDARPAADGTPLLGLEARNISAWFGDHKVLERVVAAHGAGQGDRADRPVRLRQVDVPAHPQPDARAGPGRCSWPARCCSTGTTSTTRVSRPAEVRRRIGMVFQKPNPFPAMSIYDNVASGLKLTGIQDRARPTTSSRSSLRRAGLWNEVHRRLPLAGRRAVRRPAAAAVHRPVAGGRPGRAADGRAVLGARPDLDPADRGDDRRDLPIEVTIVIVTHNMQQAAPGLAELRVLPRRRQTHPGTSSSPARPSRCSRHPARPADRRLRQRPLRLTMTWGSAGIEPGIPAQTGGGRDWCGGGRPPKFGHRRICHVPGGASA